MKSQICKTTFPVLSLLMCVTMLPIAFCLSTTSSFSNTTVTPSLPYAKTSMSAAASLAFSETTTTAAKSPTPSQTIFLPTKPKPSVNTYFVYDENVTCIWLQGAFEISIEYTVNTTESNTKIVSVDIPNDAIGTGDCNQTLRSQTLLISFFDNWSLEMVFSLDDSEYLVEDTATDVSYGITNVTLVYEVNSTLFPDSTVSQNTKQVVYRENGKGADYPRKSTGKAFYKCNSNIQLTLQNGVTVQASQLQFSAFNTINGTAFTGQADECAADAETTHTIPIVVGCAFGGLVIIVISVYSVTKYINRKRASYVGM